jgi:hypothetical protein
MNELLARRIFPIQPAYFQAVADVAAQGVDDHDLAMMRLAVVYDPYMHDLLRDALKVANPRTEADRMLVEAMRRLDERWLGGC